MNFKLTFVFLIYTVFSKLHVSFKLGNTDGTVPVPKIITKTSPCNEDPLTPLFYKVKLGCTGVYIFSYLCSKT